MNVALFGGTFDPVHSGHLSAARAAQESFRLDRILFVPAYRPPHKQNRSFSSFVHRYAMVALACAGSPGFVPSLLESPEESGEGPNYSIETVRRAAERLGPGDRLYFLTGVDAFLDIGSWRQPSDLLDACDFIIVSRPGFSVAAIENVIPRELRAGCASEASIPLRRSRLHLLTTVQDHTSASTIRRLASEGKPLAGLVPEAVGDYIRKSGLYRDERRIP